jgi:Zn-dependent oligopeptidase
MRSLITFLALITAFCSTLKAQTTNPLLIHGNDPVPFNKVNASLIKEATDISIQRATESVNKITSVPQKSKTVDNTLFALDRLQYDLTDYSMKLSVVAATYVNDETRNAANDENERLGIFITNLFLNDSLYRAVKQFAASKPAATLSPSRKKFLKETIISFEKNGLKLDASGKKDLMVLNEKLINLGTSFDKNIAESKDSVVFTETELNGVPEAISKPWKRASGKYTVYINGPNYSNVLKYALSPDSRKIIYTHYQNRAYPANIAVLDSLLYYRNAYAKKLGFKSYAAYAVVDKMSGSTATVWNFEKGLVDKLGAGVTGELAELKATKKQMFPNEDNTLNAWDFSILSKKLLDTKYNLNTDEVKEYFEMNNTLEGMFTVYQKLFSIEIKPVSNMVTWHEKVKTYEMWKDGKKIGSFYLDLFPRPNKYTHFACYPISEYSNINDKEVLPVSALICNFPEGNAEQPSLLNHGDVVTLFHEFGHLVHSMLARSELVSQGPFFVKGDFVEAPSQFLENWCWEYESLSMFAKNYKTGQMLPRSLFDKMKAAQKFGVASATVRQLYLGITDFTFEDKYDSIKGKDLVDVSKNIYAISQTPYPEGSHYICSFTHLNGYAANYYGYMWSKVFAQDMFSVFKEKGVMNPAVGLSYRKNILEKGATMQEVDMLRKFLGREPNNKAFLETLGIKGYVK